MDAAERERRLTCIECGAEADELARGWQALVGGGVVDGLDVGELEVGVYCP